jgi:hypothetical protein
MAGLLVGVGEMRKIEKKWWKASKKYITKDN